MNDPEHLAEIQRWLRYAREDLEAAETLVEQQTVAQARAVWESVCAGFVRHGFKTEDAT